MGSPRDHTCVRHTSARQVDPCSFVVDERKRTGCAVTVPRSSRRPGSRISLRCIIFRPSYGIRTQRNRPLRHRVQDLAVIRRSATIAGSRPTGRDVTVARPSTGSNRFAPQRLSRMRDHAVASTLAGLERRWRPRVRAEARTSRRWRIRPDRRRIQLRCRHIGRRTRFGSSQLTRSMLPPSALRFSTNRG